MSRKVNTLKKRNVKRGTDTQSGKNSAKKNRFSEGIHLPEDGRIKRLAGFFLILLSLYLAVAFSSFLFTHFTWGSDDALSAASFKQILLDNNLHTENWGGRLGAALSVFFIKKGFGIAAYFIVFSLLITGLKFMPGVELVPLRKAVLQSLMGIIWLPVALGFLFRSGDLSLLGGVTGRQGAIWLTGLLGNTGAGIALFFALIIILVAGFNLSLKWPERPHQPNETGDKEIAEEPRPKNLRNTNGAVPVDRYNTVEFAVSDSEEEENEETENHQETADDKSSILSTRESPPEKEVEFTILNEAKSKPDNTNEAAENNQPERFTIDTPYDPTLELANYRMPELGLLQDYPAGEGTSVKKEELEANKDKIVNTLGNYGISIDKIKATIGPTVTLYEIIPAPGVRISKIRNLEDDIALSLAAMGIRIIAPIPGKGTIGIEVPNLSPEIVPLKSIFGSEKFQHTKMELPFGMGKTIQNEPFIADLTRMPHILMAGATGQGKSVGLNAIIASILYTKHPAQVKFVMIDPKKVELTLFSKIERHFLAKLPDSEEAIITDTRKVVRTLNSLNIEMDNRYDLLKDAQVRNIKEYNTKFVARHLNPMNGHRFLPYIVVVIDEFADLIMTAGKEIEAPLTRMAQLARAIGIHLVIATQRPSVNIITGTIKANFPARIAFRVISKIDSRTILDSGGADQLVGRGDMLLSTGSDLIRLQCAFVDTPEIEKITEYIGSQRAYPDAYYLPEYADEQDQKEQDFDPLERDELFEDAARLIVDTQQGSTSLLQRKLKLGYNRAGRIIDQLEAAGIVGPNEGSKAREVKIANAFALEQFLKDRELDNPNQNF
ncbi:MAG: DNA translocase FtsK 4TM domain-containing protein [Lentimicrobiaceae bacterium]|nr:DNA translocase FtsK 4TM domain-containing protein [Lentimicrobiaceae bacterium]